MTISIKKDSVIHGDSLEILPKIPSNFATVCITDPPYNYEFIGKNWNHSEIERRKKKVNSIGSRTLVKNIPYGSGLAGGVRNERWYQRNRENILDYQEWCQKWGKEVFRILKPGGTIAVFNSNRTVAHVQVAMENAGFYAKDILIYRRSSGIPKGANLKSNMKKKGLDGYNKWDGWHSAFRNELEAITLLQKPLENNHLNTFMKYGTSVFYTKSESEKFQSNILEGFKKSKQDKFNIHTTVKPLSLMRFLVKSLTPPTKDALIIDPFAGSGSTLVAASELNFNYLGIEIEKEYIPIINQRLKESTDNPELPL